MHSILHAHNLGNCCYIQVSLVPIRIPVSNHESGRDRILKPQFTQCEQQVRTPATIKAFVIKSVFTSYNI